MKRNKLLMAAVAGMAMGASAPAVAQTKPGAGEIQCYGINGCIPESKCAVSKEDLAAFKKLVGDAEYNEKWSKSEAHACSGKGSCGAGAKYLNWVPAKPAACKQSNGFTITAEKGKKVAKKA